MIKLFWHNTNQNINSVTNPIFEIGIIFETHISSRKKEIFKKKSCHRSNQFQIRIKKDGPFKKFRTFVFLNVKRSSFLVLYENFVDFLFRRYNIFRSLRIAQTIRIFINYYLFKHFEAFSASGSRARWLPTPTSPSSRRPPASSSGFSRWTTSTVLRRLLKTNSPSMGKDSSKL
jgi:hypothetical protein